MFVPNTKSLAIAKYKRKSEDKQMKQFNYVITDEAGIHARPAGLLVKEAKNYSSKITLEANGKTAEATKLLAIMGMAVKNGTTVTVTVEGEDEEKACVEMEQFFKANF